MAEPMTDNERDRLRKLAEQLKSADPTSGNLEGVMAVAALDCLDEIDRLRPSSPMNAYELPIGTRLVIGKRSWELRHRMPNHPHYMRFREVTGDEHDTIERRLMYPSEVQAMLDAGFRVEVPRG